MERDATTLPNGFLFEDRYEILGELGSGSFGRVYRARQLSTGKSVAIKLLRAREGTESSTGREADRFRRETQIGATLSHPNIVELIDSGETQEGQLYAVFAHVPGETLEQALARDGALSVRESVRLLTQVLEALAGAHAKGIVHRDLKPANLMLSAAGVRRSALVLDFGLGGLAEGRRRKEWQTLTQTREFLGTPLYAAPEQLAGEAATERSDLYAWGLRALGACIRRTGDPGDSRREGRNVARRWGAGSLGSKIAEVCWRPVDVCSVELVSRRPASDGAAGARAERVLRPEAVSDESLGLARSRPGETHKPRSRFGPLEASLYQLSSPIAGWVTLRTTKRGDQRSLVGHEPQAAGTSGNIAVRRTFPGNA